MTTFATQRRRHQLARISQVASLLAFVAAAACLLVGGAMSSAGQDEPSGAMVEDGLTVGLLGLICWLAALLLEPGRDTSRDADGLHQGETHPDRDTCHGAR